MTSRSSQRRAQARRVRQPREDYFGGATQAWGESRPRRRGSFKRRLLILLLLLLIAASVVTLLVWQRVAAFNDTVSTAPSASSALFWPLRGSERVNVLMIGYGGAEHGGGFLSDSINVISIDPATDQTTIIPIPRDLWIEGVPAMGRHGKINEAFAGGWVEGGIDGAGERATAVVSWVTGLEIEHWMAMDFAGFREMVDAVGGVTIENPRAFSYTWSPDSFASQIWDGGTFEAGTLHLDGEAALDYTRVRYASVWEEASDFARSVRQQRVLSALRSKLGAGGLSSIGPGMQLMEALEGRLKTSLSAIDLFLLSGHIQADRRLELTEGEVLVATRNSAGQYILLPIGWTGVGSDYGSLHRFIEQGLAEPLPEPATESSPSSTSPEG